MDIALYISDLLRKHAELSVYGLGTFFKKRRRGYYDSQQNMYIPPAQQLEYRSEYKPDPRLAEYISAKKHISVVSSEYFIKNFTEDLQSRLKTEQTLEVKPLGIFHITNGIHSFIPSGDLLFDHSFFGLNPIKDIVKEPVTAPDPLLTTDPSEVAEPDEDETGRKKFPVAAFIIPLLLIAITTVYILSPGTFKYLTERPGNPRTNKIVIPEGKPETLTDSMATADSIVQSLGEQGFEIDKPRDTLKVSTQSATVSSTNITYEIIGASLNSQTDAEQMVRDFKSKGIDARIIRAENKKRNNILISLGSFNDKKSARTELVRIKNDIEPGAYIYDYTNKK